MKTGIKVSENVYIKDNHNLKTRKEDKIPLPTMIYTKNGNKRLKK